MIQGEVSGGEKRGGQTGGQRGHGHKGGGSPRACPSFRTQGHPKEVLDRLEGGETTEAAKRTAAQGNEACT